MSSRLNPYLTFRGNAREAMEFYQSIFGGELAINTFADIPGMPGVEDSDAEKVMHSMLAAPNGLTLMGADLPSGMDYAAPAGLSVSLSGDEEPLLRGYWDGLTDGATIGVPLEKAPWGDTFGMLTDKFGIPWLVNIEGQAP